MRAKLKKKAEPPQAASVCCVRAGFFGKGRRRQGLPACGKPAAAQRTAAENPAQSQQAGKKKKKKKAHRLRRRKHAPASARRDAPCGGFE